MMTIRAFNNPWQVIPPTEQAWRQRRAIHQPLIIEIGGGAGLHCIQYASENPDHFLISIERTHTKFAKMQRRLAHHPQLGNAMAYQADAEAWICQNIEPGEVQAIFILYPNPYPKAAQANKRWVNMPFMGFLLETLAPAGTLTLATNESFYYQEAKAGFTQHWGLTCLKDEVLSVSFVPRTHFEKKYLNRGETCYNLVLQKLP